MISLTRLINIFLTENLFISNKHNNFKTKIMSSKGFTRHSNHTLNRSSGKYAFSFGKSLRPEVANRIYTDNIYQIQNNRNSRSTTLGIGQRQIISKMKNNSPSPDKYYIRSSFELSRQAKKGFGFRLGRQHVTFNSFIDTKASSQLPGPNLYRLPSTLNKSRAFSIRKRFSTQTDTKYNFPGPGQYYPDGTQIASSGKYVVSSIRNINSLSMDTIGHQCSRRREFDVGPGTYNLPSTICANGGSRFFPKSRRPEPQYKHKAYIPGPGRYDIFSEFPEYQISLQR